MKLLFIISFACIIALAASLNSQKFSFTGYRLVRLYPKTKANFDLLNSLESSSNDFDIWNINPLAYMDVLLPPSTYQNYSQFFQMNKISYTVLDDNIQNKIEKQEGSVFRAKYGLLSPKSIIFKFARYSEIRSFIDITVANNKDLASSYIAGRTEENRELKVIVLKTPTSSRAVWIDCGIHAREWVTPSTCVFIIDALIEQFRDNDPTVVSLLNKYEFHILPLVNPDGYEYSHNTYRLWRKNRSKNAGSTCIGTDLNRNFDYRWRTGGSSNNPCSDLYAGSAGNSELETQAIVNAIANKKGLWDAYVSLHSYGQYWLTPFGHSSSVDERPADYDEMFNKGKIAADAIRAFNGSIFTIGSSAQVLYVNTGSSKDYFYAKENIKYSYVLELRPGAATPDEFYGFTLPEDRMPLVATETYLGIKAFLAAI